MSRRTIAVLVSALAASFGLGAALPAGAGAAKKPKPEPLSILFLLQSQGATFVKAPGLAAYRVTFTGTSETVYGFTDRPNRMAAHATVDLFVTTWKKSDFVENPPNAAMVLTKAEGGDTVVIAVLSHPRWNKAKHTLSFDAKLLRRQDDAAGTRQPRQDLRRQRLAGLPAQTGAGGSRAHAPGHPRPGLPRRPAAEGLPAALTA